MVLQCKSLTFILLMLCMSFSSCEKKVIAVENATTETPADPENEKIDQEEHNEPPVSESKKILLSGDVNGKLVIDGNSRKYDCETIVVIQGGIYTNIQIKNLKGREGCPIRITNDGLVELTGFRKDMQVSNVSHVSISGDGTPGIERGFLFRDNEYRAITLSEPIDNIRITHFEFKNIGNYVISYNSETVYDGSPGSYASNVTFSYLTANNTGALINFGGGINGSAIQGLVKNLEVSHVTFTHSPTVRNAVYVGMALDYNIHHNEFQDVNTLEDNHNAMFFLRGNGRFYDNYVNGHQGNALRAWGVSIGTAPKEILIYNNIVVNSRKYSAFEVQSFEDNMLAGKTTFVNAKIFHNTCGNLNLSRDWYGVVVDAYRLFGGTCQVFNNLAFNFPAPHPKSNFVSYMSIEKDMLTEWNNLYFNTSKAAGIVDETEFRLTGTSSAKGKGKKTALVTRDFYDDSRNNDAPSVGAVE